MNDDSVPIDDVFDAILTTWAAWGSSYQREPELLLNADEMRVDLAMSLTLSLLDLSRRGGLPEFSSAIQRAISGMSDAYDLRARVVSDSRLLDPVRIEASRKELGFS
jgi:hypothetical protein